MPCTHPLPPLPTSIFSLYDPEALVTHTGHPTQLSGQPVQDQDCFLPSRNNSQHACGGPVGSGRSYLFLSTLQCYCDTRYNWLEEDWPVICKSALLYLPPSLARGRSEPWKVLEHLEKGAEASGGVEQSSLLLTS